MIHSVFYTVQEFLSGGGAVILPELELALFALGILLIDRWLAANEKHWNSILALGGVAFSGFTLYVQYGRLLVLRRANPETPGLLGIHESLLADAFFLFFASLFLAAIALIILLSFAESVAGASTSGRYFALLLFGGVGALLLVSGVNIVTVFLGFQILVASGFALVRCEVRTAQGTRSFAGLWACGSATLALGFLLLSGIFQTTNLGRIGAILDVRLSNGVAFGGLTNWHAILALSLVAAGCFFLMEAAPLHFFSPRIYESSPAAVGAFFATVMKIAGFALLLRLYSFLFLFAHRKWLPVWAGIAVVSLLWGSVAALRRASVKRSLAYGSIAHTGFILLGLVAENESGFSGMMYYIGAFIFATAGAFCVLALLEEQGSEIASLGDLHGLAQKSPAAAALLVVFLLSLAGIPGTAGFLAKFYIVKGLLVASHPELAALAVMCAAISISYYGRIALQALKTPSASPQTLEGKFTVGYGPTLALTVTTFVTIAAGLYPEPFLRMARYAFGF